MGRIINISKTPVIALIGVLFVALFFLGFNIEARVRELPMVVVSSFEVETDFPKFFPEANFTIVRLTFKINNPYLENIWVDRIEYKIYADEMLVIEEIVHREDIVLQLPKNETVIHPAELMTLKINSKLDFLKFNQQMKDLILSNTVKWGIGGTAYFQTSKGFLSAPIQGIMTDYPSDISRIKLLVEDGEKWAPLSNAEVIFVSKYGTFRQLTDTSGLAEFEIPNTNYKLKVLKEGYLFHEEPVDLSIPQTVTKHIQLYPSIRLTIEIKDEMGSPLNDANIALVSDIGNFSKTTNASGLAEFEIPRTNYTLTVSKEGYLPYKESLDLSKSSIEKKIIQLKAEIPKWEKLWQKYRYYLIAGVIIACIVIPVIVYKIKKRGH